MSEELARRVVKCKGWRWVPGMRGAFGESMMRVVDTRPHGGVPGYIEVFWYETWREKVERRLWDSYTGSWVRFSDDHDDWVGCAGPDPDLDDPATLGCLLALVREAWGEPRLSVVWWGACWGIELDDRDFCASIEARAIRHAGKRCCIGGPCEHPATGAAEAEALAVALDATP